MTRIDEIAPDIYRISTFIEQAGLPFDQFLVVADEPLLFHTGLAMLYPAVADAVRRIMPVERLRWITFGHYEADECGAMNHWLADAPQATVAHGQIAVMLSLMDQATRPPRVLGDGEVLDLGGKRVRFIATPHVPHGWDAGLLYEETTNTLFAGDLFTAFGNGPATTAGDIVGPAVAMEDAMHATALTPLTAPTIRRLAELEPRTLALMHAPAFTGDGARALRDLADVYAARLEATVPA
ncbi:MAG: MBL fold metallo-hydrolase [Candidatus Eremiobacteraeota bacterium]|nr:MBL fold metallo-hydrolase [Candidatus Eremiobacteraeota bacterium]